MPLHLNIGAATDAYQPAERRLKITRSVIEVLSECHHPFSLVTKSSGVERDRVKDPTLIRAFISEVRRVNHDRG